jgi:hypothetical protein
MSNMSVADWSGILTLLATLVGLVFIYWQLRAIKEQSKLQTRQAELQSNQAKLQVYSDYTRRYEAIATRFPEDVNSPAFFLKNRKDYDGTMRAMRSYFDLCFEEWDLNQKRLIDGQFWKTWRSGIATAMSKTAFQQAWLIVASDSEFGSEFQGFLDSFKLSNDHLPPDIEFVSVVEAKYAGGKKIWLSFSNGDTGTRDFSAMVSREAPLFAPLSDPEIFASVAVVDGALTWPNGLDLDSSNLHWEMKRVGLITKPSPGADVGKGDPNRR